VKRGFGNETTTMLESPVLNGAFLLANATTFSSENQGSPDCEIHLIAVHLATH